MKKFIMLLKSVSQRIAALNDTAVISNDFYVNLKISELYSGCSSLLNASRAFHRRVELLGSEVEIYYVFILNIL